MKTIKEEFKKENPAVYALAQTIIAKLQEPQKDLDENRFWSLLLAYYDKTIFEQAIPVTNQNNKI